MVVFTGFSMGLWIVAVALTLPLFAQQGILVGVVQDTVGVPLPGAVLRVEPSGTATISRSQGRFRLELPPGEYRVEVRLVGYEPQLVPVRVEAGKSQELRIRLRQRAVPLPEVRVLGQQPVQPQEDARPSLITVEPRQVKYRAGAVEDLLRTLQALPGVLAVSDFSSQLIIRGSTPDQNLVLIDGFEVFNPYRLYGLISMYNPETLADIQLLTGGFPAQYGDRLSAVLDVVVRNGERERPIRAHLAASVINANMVLEGRLPFWAGSWLLSSRRTYYDLIAGPIVRSLKLVDGELALPNFGDVQLKVLLSPSQRNTVSALVILNRDNTELTTGSQRPRPDSVSVYDEAYNVLYGLSWLWQPRPGWTSRLLVSAYSNRGSSFFGGEGGSELILGKEDPTLGEFRRLQDSLRQLGLEVPRLFSIEGRGGFAFERYGALWETTWEVAPAHRLQWGVGVDFIRNELNLRLEIDPRLKALRESNPRFPRLPDSYTASVGYLRVGAYVQDRVRLTSELTLLPSVRWDYFGFLRRGVLAPRLSLSYALSAAMTLRAALGLYYQSPGYEKLLDQQVFLDFTHPRARQLKPEAALHAMVGVERMLSPEWQIRVEGYYKSFWDLIVQERLVGTVWTTTLIPGADPRLPESWSPPEAIRGDSVTLVPVNAATGRSYGVEVLLQKLYSLGQSPLYGWASYALSWAYRQTNGVRFPFSYDRRHVVNVVLGWRVSPWLDLNLTWTYGTGFPWTTPVGIKPRIIVERDSAGIPVPRIDTDWRGVTFVVDRGGLENLNRGRLPDYHRLDLRLTTYTDWFGKEWSLYLDVANVYNRANLLAIGYRVRSETLTIESRPIRMLPVLPTVGVTVRL
ncbi:MAG: TonB-dependent receptor [Candidatus Kapabacteria bacterium]|nr:TonB-dependent receptor [Candidatus Kapabacteria bacterium]MDW8225015.1 TonB-dependent receptor [Bacteroidota bacterium]